MSLEPDDRANIIRAALEVADKADSERARIPWKSEFHISPVVNLRLDQVLLNPRSHRIRAQLESDVGRDVVLAEPYSDDAQKIIERLLRKTENYNALKENLKDAKQREYGICTHLGLLVNANTRCVALRDNGYNYIRVAVLPDDAQQQEIDGLELRLQLQEDFRQDYSFSNQLLFVEDLLKTYGHSDERVAVDMSWGTPSDPSALKDGIKKVQSHVRMLDVMRQLQSLSGDRLPLTWLDDKQQAMIDLDGELEKQSKKDGSAAAAIKHNRLLGMIAGAFYRDLREVDHHFVGRYLAPYLEEKTTFKGRVELLFSNPSQPPSPELKGVDVFMEAAPAPAPDQIDAEPLLVKLAASHARPTIEWKASDGTDSVEDRDEVLKDLLEALGDAAHDARTDRQLGNLHDRPRKLLEQASKSIRRATEAYREVNSLKEFLPKPFEETRLDVDAALAELDVLLTQN